MLRVLVVHGRVFDWGMGVFVGVYPEYIEMVVDIVMHTPIKTNHTVAIDTDVLLIHVAAAAVVAGVPIQHTPQHALPPMQAFLLPMHPVGQHT